MPYCRNCGAEIRPEDKFCPNCGAKLIPTSPQPVFVERKEIVKEGVEPVKAIPPPTKRRMRIEASVVMRASRKEVYAWFSDPENWVRNGITWTSMEVTSREGNVATVKQKGVVGGRATEGTLKYVYSPPEKIEGVWLEGNWGGANFSGSPANWNFTEVPEGTKVTQWTEAEVPLIAKILDSLSKRVSSNMMLKELNEIKKAIEKK